MTNNPHSTFMILVIFFMDLKTNNRSYQPDFLLDKPHPLMLVRKVMDVKVQERLSNIILRNKIK